MVKIIADSGCDLTLEQARFLDVEIIPLHIEYNEKTYLDRLEIEPDALYQILKNNDRLPKTSQPSPAAFMTMFEKYPNDELVVLTIAKELSGTYQAAHLAKTMSEREDIYIVDTQQVTMSLLYLIYEACKLRDEGRSGKEILEKIESMKSQIKIIAIVDTLDYLQKGGRLSKTAAIAGNFLKIKPIIGVEQGNVVVLSKARGKKSAIEEVFKLLEKDQIDLSRCLFGYTGEDKSVLKGFYEPILELYPFEKQEIIQIGPAIGTHVGPGAKAIVYRAK